MDTFWVPAGLHWVPNIFLKKILNKDKFFLLVMQ